MRFALLFMISIICLSSLANANDSSLIMPIASPWEHDKQLKNQNENIIPKRLSLNDIEKTITPNFSNQTRSESTIESLYSSRIIDKLEQYGYDLFTNDNKSNNSSIPAGAVQDSYILSAGDKLNIVMRGQTNTQKDYEIDNQGRLIIENLAPITAAGRSLKSVRGELESGVASLHNTQIFITLSSVRQISILVVGHVNKPGRKNLTAFNTVLDALNASEGIQKTGSLRRIKLVRNGTNKLVDLYQLLMASSTGADKLLQDGDRIIVPPIGPTLAVSGSVKRPGIYEIRQNEKISTHQALALAGGILTPGQNRYMKMEFTSSGEEIVTDISTPKKRIFGDGSILSVAQSEQKRASAVTLSGHTRQPGTHDLKKSKSLSSLITNEKVLGQDIYPLIGVIERRDAEELTKKLIAFSPAQVLKNKFDKKLFEGDQVSLFSTAQIRSLNTDNPFLHKVSTQKNNNIDDPVLISFLKERSVFIRGAVRQAGAYPVTEGTNLKNILSVAGDLALEANKESIELASHNNGRRIIDISIENPADIIIEAGDTVRINQKFHKIATKTVSIIGEVNHPGNYDLMPGDTLLDLVKRAGGLTAQAYPDGAIFSRASERKREKTRYKAQAQDLELKLASSLQQANDDKKPDLTQINATQSLISQLKEADAVGRITVEADPATLSANPDQNILLEKGDRIFIPQRPLTVRVAGEVLSPAALQFRTNKDPLDYVREAGGTTHYADKNRTFVIYPDGSAQPLKVGSWNHNAAMIPPGSTIIVPRDPKPFDFLDSAGRVSQMIANLAISGLYIEAIGDNN